MGSESIFDQQLKDHQSRRERGQLRWSFVLMLIVIVGVVGSYFLLVRSARRQKPKKTIEEKPSTSLDFMPPLIIGAGLGTTGTRTMHEAICCLGIPSLHYARDCTDLLTNEIDVCSNSIDTFGLYDDYFYEPNPLETLNGATRQQIKHLAFDKNRTQKIPLHNGNPHPQILLIWKFKELEGCLVQKVESCDSPRTDDMALWAEDIKSLIDDVIRWHDDNDDNDGIRNVGAIHDSPYTYDLPYVIEFAKRHRGQAPIILLTERDPFDWTNARFAEHGLNLCRQDLIHGYNETKNHFQSTSHFEWFECIDRTIRAKEEILEASKPNITIKVDFNEVFVHSDSLLDGLHLRGGTEWVMEDLLLHVEYAFMNHQNYWREQSDLHLDMFKDDMSTMDIESMAHEVFLSSGAFEKPQD